MPNPPTPPPEDVTLKDLKDLEKTIGSDNAKRTSLLDAVNALREAKKIAEEEKPTDFAQAPGQRK